jgi:3-oxoacyl-[acyl-carrier protein] reductase
MERLRDKIAVITGGASGIGLATARRFLAEGAAVAVWDLAPEEALAALAAAGKGRVVFGAKVDVGDAQTVQRAADELLQEKGRVDILINSAGRSLGYQDALKLSAKAWAAMIDTNLSGAVHCVQALVPAMKRRGGGRVVNLTSVLDRYGFPGQTGYVATKAGLVGLTRVWAREFGPHGITVNAVSPGYIRTPMNEPNPPELVQAVLERTPLGRIGEPEDVANVLAFLCSDEASFLTGAVIPVDGGFIP